MDLYRPLLQSSKSIARDVAPTSAGAVTVVSVSYNSSDILPKMLISVPLGVPVVVLDNGGTDTDALTKLSDQYRFKLLLSHKNIGFGRACNRACEAVETEFLLFLNPDAVLAEGSIDALLNAAHRYPDAVAFNPLVENENGDIIQKYRSRIVPLDEFTRTRSLPFSKDATMPILTGAALLVRKRAFDDIGGFDPNIFLYFEDDDLSVRLRLAGGLLKRIAEAKVTHVGGGSSGTSEAVARTKNYHWARSRVYVTTKHDMRFPVLAAVSEALRALWNRNRFGEAQPFSVRLSLLRGALSSMFDRGAYRG